MDIYKNIEQKLHESFSHNYPNKGLLKTVFYENFLNIYINNRWVYCVIVDTLNCMFIDSANEQEVSYDDIENQIDQKFELYKMKLFIDIKNEEHDCNGVSNPQQYYWDKIHSKGVYKPFKKLDEDDVHKEIRQFLKGAPNLPMHSLDEIPLHLFSVDQLERRKFFMTMF